MDVMRAMEHVSYVTSKLENDTHRPEVPLVAEAVNEKNQIDPTIRSCIETIFVIKLNCADLSRLQGAL